MVCYLYFILLFSTYMQILEFITHACLGIWLLYCHYIVSSYSCVKDLAVYVKALEACIPQIPPNSLSKVQMHLPEVIFCGCGCAIEGLLILLFFSFL